MDLVRKIVVDVVSLATATVAPFFVAFSWLCSTAAALVFVPHFATGRHQIAVEST